ncbi:MAG: hypothetical protein LKK13_01250 [Bacilli bacterium]|jgi:hypothetical protein|nr:hypothetical protein [Bacilli bacterium]
MAVKKTHLAKILSALRKSKRKYISLEDLSKAVGLYPDVLGEELSFFDPMVMLDSGANMRNLEGPLEDYLAKQAEKRKANPSPKRVVASAKELEEYPSVASFVYRKMTFAGGLVDPSFKLSDHDLHLLQKVVNREVAKRKSKTSKKRK